MTVTSIDINPPSLQVLITEVFPFTVEWADLIGNGTTVTAPSAVMYDNSNGVAITGAFQNNYGANGTQAQYIIQGSVLQPGHTYTAILTVTVGTQIYKQRLLVIVPR